MNLVTVAVTDCLPSRSKVLGFAVEGFLVDGLSVSMPSALAG